MGLGESFAALFDGTTILTVSLWVTGMILFAVEYFQPMRGIAYTIGLVLIGSAFVTHTVHGTPGEAFMFVFITAIMMFAVHAVSLGTHRRDWLKVARLEKAGERSRKYGSLIDRIGTASTPIDLTGNVTVNDINLVVYSESPIAQGETVRIIKVTHDKIMVERVEP